MSERTRPVYRKHDAPTKRGWLFLGENGGPCDQHCQHCYYAHQKTKRFFNLQTLIGTANTARWYYGLEACDISGGEPTIMPGIEELVAHCARIGLAPTIITHGQNSTADKVKELEDAGLEDWLVSMHGIEHWHDEMVEAGAWKRVEKHMRNYKRPVRVNTTVTALNMCGLDATAQWLIDHQAPTVWNIIQFNPFYDWNGMEKIEFQAEMSRLANHMAFAIEAAEKAGWEVNVRYFPFCVASGQGFERNCIQFYQGQYDPWEWDLLLTHRIPKETVAAQTGSNYEYGGMEKARRMICDQFSAARKNDVCDSCRYHPICEGPSEQYQKRFGLAELLPRIGDPVDDVLYFDKGGAYC